MPTKKKQKKEWHTVHVRVLNDEYEKLVRHAKKERRSATVKAEIMLSKAIESLPEII